MDDSKGEKEHARRDRRQHDQPNVNSPMQPLARSAALALGKVLLVIAAHFWRQAGNVIAPASQNLAYNWINALAHIGLQTDAFCGRVLRRQRNPVAQQGAPQSQGVLRGAQGKLRVIVLLR